MTHETTAPVQSLHDQIMRLPCTPPKDANVNQMLAYKSGHRDARHAAAELAAGHEADARKAAPVAVPDEHLQTARELLACCYSWDPDVRILGNVRAGDAASFISAMLSAAPTPPAQPVAVPDEANFTHDNKTLERLLNATALLVETPCADSGTYFAACLADMEEMLASVPTPPAQQGQWVPVSERLPDQNNDADGLVNVVLALWKTEMTPRSGSHYIVTNSQYLRFNAHRFLAWMPMPAAPGDTAPPAPATAEQPECKTCGGAGFVDDGEIWCYEDGTPYECGPVKRVKDCPDCAEAAELDTVRVPRELIERISIAESQGDGPALREAIDELRELLEGGK